MSKPIHKILTISPTLDTSAYSSGDRMGSLVTVTDASRTNAGKLKIVSAYVLDKAKQNLAFDILIFDASPTIASADNAAMDLTDAEATKLVGVIPIATGDYTTAYGSNSQATKANINLVVATSADTKNLYVQLVARGAPTYAADSLTIKLGVEQL